MNPTQSDRIAKARMGIILSAPFFGSLLMRLQMIPDTAVPTFRTNGQVIRYNETFASGLSDSELRFVLVHEVCHCAQGHLWRIAHRDMSKWNHATDYQINAMLSTYVEEERAIHQQSNASGRFTEPWTFPKDGLHSEQFKGLSSEEIYNLLPDGFPNGGSGTGSGSSSSPSCGEFEASANAPDGTPIEDDWKIAVTQAATVAKMRGKLPASIARLVGELLEPKVPWREVLREFIRVRTRDDYNWTQPNRRYLHTGCVLPSLHSERMGRLAIAIDTSCSITEQHLAEFSAEVQSALDECEPSVIEVIYCDARVNGTDAFQPGDTVKLRNLGGGGTDFRPAFEHVAAAEDLPVALIYLTDGDGAFPSEEPEYPVLWATIKSNQYPFGEVVAVK